GAHHAGRQGGRGRGRSRHGDAPLPPAPEGRADLDQFGGFDLRLDARARASRQTRQQSGAGEVRRYAGEGHSRNRRGRPYDQGPRDPGRRRSEVAVDDRIPRQDRREPQEGDESLTPAPPATTILSSYGAVVRAVDFLFTTLEPLYESA